METFTTEPKGDYVREVMAELRKMEGTNRTLLSEKTELAQEVRRLKRTVTTQANEIAKLKRA